MSKKKDAETLAIVDELFARSVAGVFGQRTKSGSLLVRYPPTARFPLCLGLATRLQRETSRAVTDANLLPAVRRMISDYPETPADLAVATTDHLLGELYRSASGDWVLGLLRPSRKRGGHWSGLCWNGCPLTCAGVASVVVEAVQANALAARLQQATEPTAPMALVEELMKWAFEHAERRVPSKTILAGYLKMSEHVVSQFGRDGLPGDDLESFVRIDWEPRK